MPRLDRGAHLLPVLSIASRVELIGNLEANWNQLFTRNRGLTGFCVEICADR